MSRAEPRIIGGVLGPAIVRLIASLDGRQISDGWIAHCPAHDDRRPSLSVRVVGDRVLVKCHTGCSQAAVIAALRDRGLWPGQARQQRRDAPLHLAADTSGRHIAIARHLWERAVPAGGTLVETYLRSRGIEIIPERVLRYPTHVYDTHAARRGRQWSHSLHGAMASRRQYTALSSLATAVPRRPSTPTR